MTTTNTAHTLNLTRTLAKTETRFAHAIDLVVVARRFSVERFGRIEVYSAMTDDAPEMLLGYADELGKLGSEAAEALRLAIYSNGIKPRFED